MAEDARDLLRVVRGEPDEAHVGGKENQLLDLSGLASLVSGDGIDRFPCELGSLRIEEGEGRRGLWNLGEQVLDDGVRVARMNVWRGLRTCCSGGSEPLGPRRVARIGAPWLQAGVGPQAGSAASPKSRRYGAANS